VNDQDNIPTLTDLIEPGAEISITDLGLDEELGLKTDVPDNRDTEIDLSESELIIVDPFKDNPALEQTVRRILDEHLELAWQEIKLAIQRDLNKR
jgi:hypothetical protein